MKMLVCPTREELAHFDNGKVPEADVERIGEHLEECDTCRAMMETIVEPGDSLTAALRRPSPQDEFEAESGLRRLIGAVGREPTFSRRPTCGQSGEDIISLGALGQYKLLAKLGQGGMGAVYKALHTKLDKVVALKVLPAERMQDRAAVERFEREMRAVGKLEHPNIVRAMDAGEIDGRHYLVMERVDGIDLSALLRRVGPLRPAEACELVRQAAVGLQEAHEHGMVHRDIKPSNLMLARRRTKPPIVKVLDLGLALLEEQSAPKPGGLTTTGQTMGTLEYMAPEQGSDSHVVDIRADIYSLGATLYKLLCGEAPFPSDRYNTPVKLLTALAIEPVPSIATKREDLPGELAAVVDRMLAKNPEDRFDMPQHVADALAPFAQGADLAELLDQAATESMEETLEASDLATLESQKSESAETFPTTDVQDGPDAPRVEAPRAEQATTTAGLAGKPQPAPSRAARRTPMLTAVAGLGCLVLLGMATLFFRTPDGTIIVEIDDPAIEVTFVDEGLRITDASDGQAYQIKPGEKTLRITRGELQFNTDKFEVKRGEKVVLAVRLVEGDVRVVRGDTVIGQAPVASTPTEPRSVAAKRPEQPPVSSSAAVDLENAIAKDAQWQPGPADDVLPGIIPRPAKLPGIRRWQVLPMPREAHVYLSPDGNYLAWTPVPFRGEDCLVLQETESRRAVGFLPLPDHRANATGYRIPLAWHPHSTHLAVVEDGDVHFMGIQGEVRTIRHQQHYADYVRSLAWSPDGKTLAVTEGGNVPKVRLYSSEGSEVGLVTANAQPGTAAWSPDGRQFAVGASEGNVVYVFGIDGSTGPVLKGHEDVISAVAWNPDGKWIASGSRGGEVRLWKPDGTAGPVQKTAGQIKSLAWSPDGRWLAFHDESNAEKRGVKVWRPADAEFSYVSRLSGKRHTIHWSPDSKWLVINALHSHDGPTQLFAPDGSPGPQLGRDHDSVAWSADGSRLLLADSQRTTQWFSVDGKTFPATVAAKPVIGDGYVSVNLSWSPDGERLALGGHEGTVQIWHAGSAAVVGFKAHDNPHEGRVNLTWSPDSKWLASGGGEVRLWQIDGTPGATLVDGLAGVVAWSPDGRWLACEVGYRVEILKPDGAKRAVIAPGQGNINMSAISWSPDGERFAVVVGREGVMLFEADGAPAGLLKEAPPYAPLLAWSPDGQEVAVGGVVNGRAVIRVLKVDGADRGKYFDLHAPGTTTICHLAWSDDSKGLTAYHKGGHVIRWGLDGQQQESRHLGKDVVHSAPSPDAERLAIVRNKGVVEMVNAETDEVQWIGVPLSGGQAAAFTLAGQLLHAPPEVERQLIYVVERPNGQFAVMPRGEFLRRVNLSPEQTALQWIVDTDGSFQLEGDESVYSADNIKRVADLPEANGAAVHVNLRGNNHFTPHELALLATLKNLAGLDVSHTKVGAPAVEQVGQFSSLKELELSHTRVNNSALTHLAALENLTALRLNKTVVSSDGLAHLASLAQLRELDLSGTNISDLRLDRVAKLAGLESLDLSGTSVSDAGLQALENCASLRRLDLTNTRVTDSGVAALRESLPECEVRVDGEGLPPEDGKSE